MDNKIKNIITNTELAKASGLSERQQAKVKNIVESATDSVKVMARQGDISINQAEMAAKQSDEIQEKITEILKENKKMTVEKAIKKIHQEQRHEGIKKRYESAGEITGGKILEGDLFEKITEVPDNSVDLLFADPPYMVLNEQWDTYESVESFMQFTKQWLDAVMPKLNYHRRCKIVFKIF